MSKDGSTGFALIGAGAISDNFRQAIEGAADLGARLVAVAHHDPGRFESIGERFGVPCLTFDEVLTRSDVDAVCVITPSGQHAEQAIAAASAGKHVLVEKPMALRLGDADAMIDASQAAGVKLGVCFQRRTVPIYQQIQRAISAGDLGELTLGLITMPYLRPQAYFDSGAWRGTWALDGGGVLMNQGIHQVDLLVWLMGDPVEVVAQAATLRRRIEVEDTLGATLRFGSGALATVMATTTAGPGFPHRLEIYGTNGAIQTEGDAVVRWELVDHTKATASPPAGRPGSGGAAPVGGRGGWSSPRTSARGHSEIVRDFIGAIREDRPPLIDGPEGRRALATVLAIYRAAGLM